MNATTIKQDFFGGLTAAIVALPLALAFGVQSGLGAVAGLYGAIALGFFASLLGGTPTQVSGPTGPMTVVSAVVIATFIEKFGSIPGALPYIVLTFALAGVFQIVLGVFRVGQMVRYIPYPVISGFMTGIGAIIIFSQIFPMLGHASPKHVFHIISLIHEPLSNINYYALALTLGTIAIIYAAPRIIRIVPGSLLAFIVLTFVASYFALPVPTIGEIPSGIPKLQLFSIFSIDPANLKWVIFPAITLGALGAIDSLLTSVIADNMTQTKHSSNRELIGQGIGNIISSSIAGIPGAGATMRTVVNINAGGRTRLSGMLHSVFLFVVLVGAGKYAAMIPNAVLAGILITVGLSIIDSRGLKHVFTVPRTESLIMITVFLLTVFVDLLQAVAAGMVLAAIFFMKKISDLVEEKTTVAPIDLYAKELSWADEKDLPKEFASHVYIKHIDGPLFFGFTSQFRDLIQAIPDVRYVIIRMKNVPYIDQSGLYALEDAILYLASNGVEVMLTELQKQPNEMLRRITIIPRLVPGKNIFDDFVTCVKNLTQTYRTNATQQKSG